MTEGYLRVEPSYNLLNHAYVMQSTVVLPMNFLENHSLCLFSNSTIQDDILIQKLLLTHDPDGRWLDSETMLHAVGNIMFHASSTEAVPSSQFTSFSKNDICEIELLGCLEPVGCIIRKISCKILSKCSGEGDINSRTMALFDLLGNYRWDAKAVLVLAAFAASYGEFCQVMQLYPRNALAVSILRLKQLPSDLRPLKPRFKALSLLVKTMMDVAKCIIKFESLPFPYVELGNEILLITKYHIYVAVYWITRSTLACFSQVTDFTTKKYEHSDSTIIAAWELSSLAYRLSNICSILKSQVEACHQEIERNLHNRLLSLADEVQFDNQEALHLLFPLNNYLPLKDCSTQEKLGVSELKNKIVLLLISKPQLLTLEELFLLVHQTSDHPLNEKLKDNYKIVWIPLPSSDAWTDAEESSFNFISDFLPWYAVRKPRLLSSAVVKYIREEWNYKEVPLMVVLDSNGKVINTNALDMVKIWGPRAYPFSASKEAELWQDENLTMQLLLSDINPLLAYWVEEGKNLCIYGSDNLGWIRQFKGKIEELKRAGLQLEIVYVCSNPFSEHAKEIKARAAELNLRSYLSFTKLQFFWLRLESIRRSKFRLGKTTSSDNVLAELSALVDMNDRDEGWVVIGRGSSTDIIRLQGREVMECLNKYPEWGENVETLGLLGAMRNFLEPTFLGGPCSHSYLVPSSEGLVQGTVVCQVCKRPMNRFVVYE